MYWNLNVFQPLNIYRYVRKFDNIPCTLVLILGPFSFSLRTEVCNSFLSSAFVEFYSMTSGHCVFYRNIKLPERCLADKRIYFHTRAQNQASQLLFFLVLLFRHKKQQYTVYIRTDFFFLPRPGVVAQKTFRLLVSYFRYVRVDGRWTF
jgi:hypothetical protein